MASRPKKSASRPRSARPARAAAASGPSTDPREAIVDAMMALVAERGIYRVGLSDIAARAGVSLATLRAAYDGKLRILAAFSRRIDVRVLEASAGGTSEENPRDRLFEVMMRRFDALAPYKEAIRRVAKAARRDPGLACVLHGIAAGSQRWMLSAAGIERRGPFALIFGEGAVLIYLDAMRAWLDDDDPGLAKTMAALDKGLGRGQRAMQVLADICSFLPRMAERGRRRREEGEAAAG